MSFNDEWDVPSEVEKLVIANVTPSKPVGADTRPKCPRSPVQRVSPEPKQESCSGRWGWFVKNERKLLIGTMSRQFIWPLPTLLPSTWRLSCSGWMIAHVVSGIWFKIIREQRERKGGDERTHQESTVVEMEDMYLEIWILFCLLWYIFNTLFPNKKQSIHCRKLKRYRHHSLCLLSTVRKSNPGPPHHRAMLPALQITFLFEVEKSISPPLT